MVPQSAAQWIEAGETERGLVAERSIYNGVSTHALISYTARWLSWSRKVTHGNVFYTFVVNKRTDQDCSDRR